MPRHLSFLLKIKITILDISLSLSFSLSLTGEEGVRTLFTGQREREIKRGGRERKRKGEREKKRESCMHVQAETAGVL